MAKPPLRGTQIIKPEDLLKVAEELGVREDWHEPDEQGLTAEFRGSTFDNAGFWGGPTADPNDPRNQEMHIVLWKDVDYRGGIRRPVASINLATLLSWATEHAKALASQHQRHSDI